MLGGVKAVSLPTGKVGRLSFSARLIMESLPAQRHLPRITSRDSIESGWKGPKSRFPALFGTDLAEIWQSQNLDFLKKPSRIIVRVTRCSFQLQFAILTDEMKIRNLNCRNGAVFLERKPTGIILPCHQKLPEMSRTKTCTILFKSFQRQFEFNAPSPIPGLPVIELAVNMGFHFKFRQRHIAVRQKNIRSGRVEKCSFQFIRGSIQFPVISIVGRFEKELNGITRRIEVRLMPRPLLNHIGIFHIHSDIEIILAVQHADISFFIEFGSQFFRTIPDPVQRPDIRFLPFRRTQLPIKFEIIAFPDSKIHHHTFLQIMFCSFSGQAKKQTAEIFQSFRNFKISSFQKNSSIRPRLSPRKKINSKYPGENAEKWQ